MRISPRSRSLLKRRSGSAVLRARQPYARTRGDGTLRLGWHPSPAQAVVLAFATVILAGTLLLMLPIAAAGTPATFLQALFTATSAVCVTGLTVVDTATFWSPLGQFIVIALIQLGGFGIMTFVSLIGIGLARKMSLQARLNAAVEVRTVDFDDARGVVSGVLRLTVAIEGGVALLLALSFGLIQGEPPLRAITQGLFHAVSAFNNAGFALFSDNLAGYVSDPTICLPICAAIILGGLGFPALMQIRRYGLNRHGWTITTRMVLLMTPIMLAGGTIGIAINEWDNPGTLGPLPLGAKVLAAFTTSVQTRTAGFNVIDMGALDPATMLGMDALMFIGAGPAGTAGGIKVTTFLVMLAFVYAEVRGTQRLHLMGKRIPQLAMQQAMTVGLLGAGCIGTAVVILSETTDASLDALLFEACSAFGTVGLSANLTPSLPPHAQFIIITLMFVGRLGPVTLGVALARARRPVPYDLPEERPIIG
ncbi:TrkH family potassium uptake protein [Pseudoclavibacter albus]|uniref:TrkH family potassium uptake protein n=1 Tax=Pseudoclavibacter albus TaxID=272241 RepID=UPI0030B99FE8